MPKTYSIAQARHDLAAIVHELEHHPFIQFTRRGEPVAVLLSIPEYQRLQNTHIGFWEAYHTFRSNSNFKQLAIDAHVFKNVRDASPGREVQW